MLWKKVTCRDFQITNNVNFCPNAIAYIQYEFIRNGIPSQKFVHETPAVIILIIKKYQLSITQVFAKTH